MRLSVYSPEEQQQESNFSQKGASAGDDGGSAESGGATNTIMAAALKAAGADPQGQGQGEPGPCRRPSVGHSWWRRCDRLSLHHCETWHTESLQ